MKNIKKLTFVIISSLLMGACVSGGFDENPQLDALNAAQAKAPKVVSISVNGTVINRDEQSIRHVDAKIGDILNISAIFESGQGSVLEDFRFEQTYFSTEIEEFNTIYPTDQVIDLASQYTFGPVDPGSDGIYNGDFDEAIISLNGNNTFEYNYTVTPFVFDDGVYDYTYYTVDPGDQISIHFRPRNSSGYYGHMTLVINVVE